MRVWEGFQRGINLGGWFSQCDYSVERFENFIRKEDIAKIASWGMDHVRVPIDYNLVEEADGTYIEKGFDYITRIISWCEEYRLHMILDLHKTMGYSFDSGEAEHGFFEDEKCQERFYRLWEQFATRFARYDFVAFELLNEITDPSYMPEWNRISNECVRRIRAIAPTTYILIGGYWNNSVNSVKDIAAPADEYIIYNFHCYDPIVFTHQGAPWLDMMPADFTIRFDDTYRHYSECYENVFHGRFGYFPQINDMDKPFDEEFFIAEFAEALKAAEERNVPLYCGEYGVINRTDPKEALKWYRTIHKVFRKYHIGNAAWSYREMDFGFVDEHFAPVLDEVLAVITE